MLPIGGLKQKILAAHRVGLKTVVFPQRNEPDLDDVPEDVRQEMTFHMVEFLDEVLEHALSPAVPLDEAAVNTLSPVEMAVN